MAGGGGRRNGGGGRAGAAQGAGGGGGGGGSGGGGGAPPGAEFTPVVCRGVVDEDASLRVGPRARSEMGITKNGGLVVSPLRLEGGGSALVLRGWAPDTWQASEAPPTPGEAPGGGGGGGGGGGALKVF